MKPRKILLFLAAVLAVLALLAIVIPDDEVSVAGFRMRYPTMKSVLRAATERHHRIGNGDALPPEMAMLRDSIDYYQGLVDSSDLCFWMPYDGWLDPFWEQAEQAADTGRTIRILHYGDSQIEMDHITSRLRSYMQQTFGGGGPGMLPVSIITPIPSVHLGTSGDLTHLASFGDSNAVRSRGNYGPMMQSFRLDGVVAVSMKTSRHKNIDDRIKQFSRITLLYNNHGGKLTATVATTHTADHKGVSSCSWSCDSTDHFRMKVSGNADLYGILVDCGPGVAVDNIPMRGCSGQQFTLVDKERLTAAYRQMDVGMIIMQFGGNSVPYFKTEESISTYCQSIGKQIDHLHHCCPDARIVFVGPSDMGRRKAGQFQTYPLLPVLIDSLIATANAHDAAYWSIYHAMGGENSMAEWVNQGLAGKDYIHFSQKGADLMGDRMAEAFANSYTLYTLRRRWEKGGAQ